MKNNNQTDNRPIDFVIAWVDGNDPEWRKEKASYSKEKDDGDQREVRFRDWDTLRYWFRGIETFAPWVNRIHFVTWGHLPEWLNADHPKLHIVNHRDYIPEEYLPTFNSHTIELNLHRIEGLAEQFVYFNDDMFLTAPVNPEEFFRKGLPCDTFALNAIYFGKDSVGPINGNDISLINEHFDKRRLLKKNWTNWFAPVNGLKNLFRSALLLPWPWFTGFMYAHTSTNLLKSTMEEVWEKEFEVLDQTCRDQFRQKTNVNQWVFKYWQLAKGAFVPVSMKKKHCYHVKAEIESACQSIEKGTYKEVCINDTGKTTEFEEKAARVRSSFEKLLPKKSAFEK